MNETANALMQTINQASFAMDDVVLFLDTHPDDANALSYFHYVAAIRRDAINAYESQFGPLTAAAENSTQTWSWLENPWPWEGEV